MHVQLIFLTYMSLLGHNPFISQGRPVVGPRFERMETRWLGRESPCIIIYGIKSREITLLECKEVWGKPGHSSSDNMMAGGPFKNKYKNTTMYKTDSQQGSAVCIVKRTLLNILWQSIYDRNLKKNEYIYTFYWFTLLYTQNQHNIVNRLYSN